MVNDQEIKGGHAPASKYLNNMLFEIIIIITLLLLVDVPVLQTSQSPVTCLLKFYLIPK